MDGIKLRSLLYQIDRLHETEATQTEEKEGLLCQNLIDLHGESVFDNTTYQFVNGSCSYGICHTSLRKYSSFGLWQLWLNGSISSWLSRASAFLSGNWVMLLFWFRQVLVVRERLNNQLNFRSLLLIVWHDQLCGSG